MTTSRTLRLLCILLAASLFVPVALATDADRSSPYAAIQADIEKRIAAGELTGVSVALVKDGRIVWEQGFGWADQQAQRRATAHTAFSIASTTKPFTTTAMMLLVADGVLDLDRPANDYLGDHKLVDAQGPARSATLRRIASHSAGLPTLFGMYPEGSPGQQPSIDELLRNYGHLMAPVGERYEYSNLGMGIVADIVARQSRQEFGQYLRERVLLPLGMRDSFFDTDRSRRGEMAVRYADDGTPLPFYLTATPGSGEMYASAHDLARFAMLHLGGQGLDASAKILDPAHLDELHRPATLMAPGFHYALGWEVYDAPGQLGILHHRGGQSGVTAEFVLVPSANAAAIVLSNRRGPPGFIADVRDRLLKSVVPEWTTVPSPPAPRLQPLQPAQDYCGRWRGTLLAQGKPLSVQLTINADGTGTLAIGDGPAQPITDLGLLDGQLSGDSHGDIGSPDTRRDQLDQVALGLTLRGDRIDGEIVAWRKTSTHMAMWPYWTELRRQP